MLAAAAEALVEALAELAEADAALAEALAEAAEEDAEPLDEQPASTSASAKAHAHAKIFAMVFISSPPCNVAILRVARIALPRVCIGGNR